MPDKTPLRELKAKALETAYRYDAYSMYGGKEAGAVRALLRRTHGYDKKDLRKWFLKALEVQSDVAPWLRDNADAVRTVYVEQRSMDFGDVATSFFDSHKGWPKRELISLLAINYFYFYLK